MSQNAESEPTTIQVLLQKYLHLFSQQSWNEWIDLWSDDGVLEFPFAPVGRRSRYVGKADILTYMKGVAVRMSERIKSEGVDYFTVHPMRDPETICLEMAINGHILENGAPYLQKYIAIVETKGGKLSLFREYWNPIVAIDANGGREQWTAAFGSPEQDGRAS